MDGLLTGEAFTVDQPLDLAASAETLNQVDWEGWLTQNSTLGSSDSSHSDPDHSPMGAIGTADDGMPFDQRPEAKTQHLELESQLQTVSGWQDSIRQLAEWGVTPEQLAAELQALRGDDAPEQNWTGEVAPEEQFAAWLAQQELSPDECSRAELLSLEGAWRQEQMLAHYQQQTMAAQEQALRAQWHVDLQLVETAYPEFGNPVLRDALLNLYEGRFGIEADYDHLSAVAEELAGTIRSLSQTEVARYAQSKHADAIFPVFAGGTSPAPHGGFDFHQLSPTMQQEYLESHFSAAGGA